MDPNQMRSANWLRGTFLSLNSRSLANTLLSIFKRHGTCIINRFKFFLFI